MSVSVIVPWRGGCVYREDAWAWVRTQYEWHHPKWEVVTGTCEGPWRKAVAVADALSRATGDVLVVADADVWCHGLGVTVDALERGQWRVPHKMVYRLDSAATERVVGKRAILTRAAEANLAERAYSGIQGGGLVVLDRATYERVPLDPRFVGWGQEDIAWGYALRRMVGRAGRHDFKLYHLWHPPAQRKSRAAGSDENERLINRYVAARQPGQMAALLEEAKACQ